MRHVLNKADCIEMLECKAFYKTTHAPMFNHDLAFVFECSQHEVRAVLNGTHPALLDIPFVNSRLGRPKKEPKVKPAASKPREITKPIGAGHLKTHCGKGHEFTADNVHLYTDKSGHQRRRCLKCRDQYAYDYYHKNK